MSNGSKLTLVTHILDKKTKRKTMARNWGSSPPHWCSLLSLHTSKIELAWAVAHKLSEWGQDFVEHVSVVPAAVVLTFKSSNPWTRACMSCCTWLQRIYIICRAIQWAKAWTPKRQKWYVSYGTLADKRTCTFDYAVMIRNLLFCFNVAVHARSLVEKRSTAVIHIDTELVAKSHSHLQIFLHMFSIF